MMLQIYFFKSIPKTATGKVQRQMVAKAVLAREAKISPNTALSVNHFGGIIKQMIRVAQGVLRSFGNCFATLKALPWMIGTQMKQHLKTT